MLDDTSEVFKILKDGNELKEFDSARDCLKYLYTLKLSKAVHYTVSVETRYWNKTFKGSFYEPEEWDYEDSPDEEWEVEDFVNNY